MTREEFEIIKKHTVMGYQKLKETQIMSARQLNAPLFHHEAMDGTGCPKGLKGNQIHKYARVARILDCYDALTTRRSYKNALPISKALGIMSGEMGPTFDGQLLEEFARFIGQEGKAVSADHGKRINLEPGNEVQLEFWGNDFELKSGVLRRYFEYQHGRLCKVVLKPAEDNPLPNIGIGDDVRVYIRPHGNEKPPLVSGTIRHINMAAGKALPGIQFDELNKEVITAIRQCEESALKAGETAQPGDLQALLSIGWI